MKPFNVGNISTHALLNKCTFHFGGDDTQTLGFLEKSIIILFQDARACLSPNENDAKKKYFAILLRIRSAQYRFG